MKLHYNKLSPVAFAATTAQAGFPASNVGFTSIGRPLFTTTAGANDLTLTLAAAQLVQTLHLHDVNFAAANVFKSADGVTFNLVGALTTYYGKESRRRGYITINDPNVKAVKISIAAGAPTDGLTYWRVGAAYLFSAVATVGSPFQFAYSTHLVRAQVRGSLANKQPAVARTGFDFHEILVPFRVLDSEDIEPLVNQARAGIILMDLALANFLWQVWPVRLLEDDMRESYNDPKVADVGLTFTEVV